MPSLSLITATFFLNLINRLGVRPPPPAGFELLSTVQPVSIVDSDISIPAIVTTQNLGLSGPATAGPIINPAANAVLADTGQLAAGTWQFLITVGVSNSGTSDFIIRRRNAADAADIWRQVNLIGATASGYFTWTFTTRMELNERIRINELTLGVNTVEANIWSQQISL